MDAPVGTFIAYSTAPGKVASDGELNNGLFTYYLLKHMKTVGLSINDVFRLTRKDVFESSKSSQIPWDSSSLLTKFCFTGCSKEDIPISETEEKKIIYSKPKEEKYIKMNRKETNEDLSDEYMFFSGGL